MKIGDAKAFIKLVATKNIHVPPMLVGSMGVGKSAIVAQAASELSIGFIDLRLAQQEPGDLIGIPRIVDGVTVWAKPGWFPKEGTRGILFLDELNRAPTDVRQAVFQLVKDWRMHTHVLPTGWTIVSAINPDNGLYQVETLDPAMLRRFCVLRVTSDVESWLTWAHGPGNVDKTITGFISANPQLLAVSESFEIDTKPTNDQWSMLNLLMAGKAVPKEIEIEVFQGLVGREGAIAFRKWLDSNYERPVSGEDVINGYAKVAERVKKQRNDEMHSTVMELIAELESIPKPTKKQLENLIQFLKDVSPEFQATTAKKLPKQYIHEIVKDPALLDNLGRMLEELKTAK